MADQTKMQASEWSKRQSEYENRLSPESKQAYTELSKGFLLTLEAFVETRVRHPEISNIAMFALITSIMADQVYLSLYAGMEGTGLGIAQAEDVIKLFQQAVTSGLIDGMLAAIPEGPDSIPKLMDLISSIMDAVDQNLQR